MNPGKRRKMQKIEFLKQRIEENVKKLEESINAELVSSVVENSAEVVQEEVNLPENPIAQIAKKKKKTS